MGIEQRAFRFLLQRFNTESKDHYTYRARPKAASGVGLWSDPETAVDGFAVMMQGPVCEQDQFTLETLRIYRKLMPTAKLIVSTWEDTPASMLAPIRKEGVDVVLSRKPQYPGILNINMQLESAKAGINHAIAGGAKWVVKTRTDQRMLAPNLPAYLVALARTFPVKGDWPQRHRIFGLGMGTLKYGLYHLTDQTVFGWAEDMLQYWSPPYREDQPRPEWPTDPAQRFATVAVGELYPEAAPETYFAAQYLTRIGRTLDWTIADSWAAFRDHFGVADLASTDFYWIKNQASTFLEDDRRYASIDNRLTLDFKEWLLLYAGALGPEAAEHAEPSLRGYFYDDVSPPEMR
jgi:hypothetical protein